MAPMRLRAVLLALLVMLGAPAAARANALSQVLRAFSTTGHLDPCAFSSATLNAALGEIPADVEQYTPELRGAISAALADRARGACDQKSTTPGATTTPAGTPSAPAPTTPGATGGATGGALGSGTTTSTGSAVPGAIAVPPSPPVAAAAVTPSPPLPFRLAGAATNGGVPAPLWVLGGLAALAALAALVTVVSRALGWAPRWAPNARQAWGEAGFRAGSRWADFSDFLRSRR